MSASPAPTSGETVGEDAGVRGANVSLALLGRDRSPFLPSAFWHWDSDATEDVLVDRDRDRDPLAWDAIAAGDGFMVTQWNDGPSDTPDETTTLSLYRDGPRGLSCARIVFGTAGTVGTLGTAADTTTAAWAPKTSRPSSWTRCDGGAGTAGRRRRASDSP